MSPISLPVSTPSTAMFKLAQTCCVTSSLSPVTILTVTPLSASAASAGPALRFGRIEKSREALEHQLRLVADHGMRVVERNASPGDAQESKAVFFEGDALAADLRERRRFKRALARHFRILVGDCKEQLFPLRRL